MTLFGLNVYQHPAIPEDEAWVVRDSDAEELPAELRGKLSTPCVVTGDAARLGRIAALLGLAELWESALGALPHPSGGCRASRARLRQERNRRRHSH